MKQSVNIQDFHTAFINMGRESQFTYSARVALFDYLKQWEAETGEELKLDVISLCCDFAESSPMDIADYYGIDLDSADGDLLEIYEIVADYLINEGAYVAHTDDGLLYRQF